MVDLSTNEAVLLLKTNKNSLLIDVRTPDEEVEETTTRSGSRTPAPKGSGKGSASSSSGYPPQKYLF